MNGYQNPDYKTWQDWAKAAGVYDQFSAHQIALGEADPDYGWATTSNKVGYANAQTPEEKAQYHGYQTELNRTKGFTGGTDGSLVDYNPAQILQNETRDKVLNYGPFSWDAKTDPSYQAYMKAYTREGRRASEDALGQYSAMTGGRPSTAAVTASQQAGNYYASQMADKIPELYNQAYQRYLQEYSRLLGEYELAAGENATSRAAVQDAEQTAYQRRLAADETQYALEQEAWERQWKDAQLRAQYGDYSGLRALGIDVDAWLASQQTTTGGGSGGSGSKGGNGGNTGGNVFKISAPDSPDYLGTIQNALQTGYTRDSTISTLANQKNPVPADDILMSRQMEIEDTNRGGYVPTAAETLAKEVSAITTQKQAIEWLTSKGLSSRDWQIPSEAAFNRGKDDPQSDYYGYSTYAQFLRDYVQYIYSEFGGK